MSAVEVHVEVCCIKLAVILDKDLVRLPARILKGRILSVRCITDTARLTVRSVEGSATCSQRRLRRCLAQELAVAHQAQSLIAHLNGPDVSFGSSPLYRLHELGVEKKRIQPLGLINQLGLLHTANLGANRCTNERLCIYGAQKPYEKPEALFGLGAFIHVGQQWASALSCKRRSLL
jgi:hypothetical protein